MDCPKLLANCNKVRQDLDGHVSVEVLTNWRQHEQEYGSSIPSLIIDKKVMAKGLASESDIRDWAEQSIRANGHARIELMLWGAGCNRFETVKKLVEELITEHWPEEKLEVVKVQDQNLQEQTDGDMALMIEDRLFLFFGRIPTRAEVSRWFSSVTAASR